MIERQQTLPGLEEQSRLLRFISQPCVFELGPLGEAAEVTALHLPCANGHSITHLAKLLRILIDVTIMP